MKMWETELSPEPLQLHRVYKDRISNSKRSKVITLRPTGTLFKTHVHMSHVLFQPITKTAHYCAQCISIVTQYTDTFTVAMATETFTENLHVTGTEPVSLDTCKSRQQNYVQKVSPV